MAGHPGPEPDSPEQNPGGPGGTVNASLDELAAALYALTKLEVEPGDLVVAHVHRGVAQEQTEHMTKVLQAMLPPMVKALVVAGDARLDVDKAGAGYAAAVEVVGRIHRRSHLEATMGEHRGRHYCVECTTSVDDFTAYVDWPCPTMQALAGTWFKP